jgi:nitrate reductase NapE component
VHARSGMAVEERKTKMKSMLKREWILMLAIVIGCFIGLMVMT